MGLRDQKKSNLKTKKNSKGLYSAHKQLGNFAGGTCYKTS